MNFHTSVIKTPACHQAFQISRTLISLFFTMRFLVTLGQIMQNNLIWEQHSIALGEYRIQRKVKNIVVKYRRNAFIIIGITTHTFGMSQAYWLSIIIIYLYCIEQLLNTLLCSYKQFLYTYGHFVKLDL